jgi:hypothetical protein
MAIRFYFRKRYKCKSCSYQFSKETTKEYPLSKKLEAIKLLKEGGRILGVIPNKPKVFNFNFIFSIIFSNNFQQISPILLKNSSKKSKKNILSILKYFGFIWYSFEIVKKWAKQMANIIEGVQIDEMCIQIKQNLDCL